MALSIWIITVIIMVGTSAVADRCEDQCAGCSTTSIICQNWESDMPAVVAALPPYTQVFNYLELKENTKLGETNFKHLTELKVLIITGDVITRIAPIPSSAQDIFDPLTKLEILRINTEWHFELPLEDLFRPLVHLKGLDLSQTRRLNITNLQRAMYGLSNSTTLKTIGLSNFQTYGYDIIHIFNLTWFLEPVKDCPIKDLDLSGNTFTAIYPGITRYAPLLENLDASCNVLSMPLTSAFFIETILHKGLKEARFSHLGWFNCDGPEKKNVRKGQTFQLLGSDKKRLLISERLTRLSQRSSGTGTLHQSISAFIPNDVAPEPWVQCIKAIINDTCAAFSPNCSDIMNYLRYNHGQFCEFLYRMFDDPPSENFYRGIPCSALPMVDDLFVRHCGKCITIPLIGSVKRMNLSQMQLTSDYEWKIWITIWKLTCFHKSNQLEYLDLSSTNGPFENFLYSNGLMHMKVFNLSNSLSHRLLRGLFVLQLPSLQILDMSSNSISLHISHSLESVGPIRILNFADNVITSLPYNFFSNVSTLQELDLSHNIIQDFDFNVSALYSLKNLNLEYNMISEIPEATCQELSQLAEHVAPRIVTVDISNNPLSCSCLSIYYLTFMNQTKPSNLVFHNYDEYMCRDQAGNLVSLHKMNLHSLWWDCLGPEVYVGIGVAITTVVITIISVLVMFIYRKRWWFRYQYFLAHRVWKNYHKIETLDTPFEYDLFVSYNQHDYQCVDKVLQPKLEDELGLRLCLHHRDFRLGEIITEQIVESIQSSKKTLFILSKSFLASTWCHFEIRMAQTRLFTSGKDVILLALLESLPDRMVSKTLKGLLETRTYVEWTENDTYGQRLFWEKLYESVKAPIAQPFELEERPPPPGIQTEEMRDPSIEEAAAGEREPLLARS